MDFHRLPLEIFCKYYFLKPIVLFAIFEVYVCIVFTVITCTDVLSFSMFSDITAMENGLNIELYENAFQAPDDIFKSLETEIQYLPADQCQVRVHGKTFPIPRQLVAFGDPHLTYTFSGLTVACKPWTPLLLGIKQAVERVSGESYNFVLVNRYKDGNCCIGHHKDNEQDLDANSAISSVSFGEMRTMIFKRPNYPDQSVELKHNTLLVMKPPTNRDWTHGIPRQKDRKGTRLNLTFRKMTVKRKEPETPTESPPETRKKPKMEEPKVSLFKHVFLCIHIVFVSKMTV